MAPYTVTIYRSAQKTLARIPQNSRLIETIGRLAGNPRPSGAKALRGTSGLLRIRVGDYRIVYRVQDENRTVLVVRIGHRREIYRRISEI